MAPNAAAEYIIRSSPKQDTTLQSEAKRLEIKCVVLETPFTSVSAMLVIHYPQKWLPYRCLHHTLGNHWNRRRALSQIATSGTIPKVLILQAGEDELAPPAHSVSDRMFVKLGEWTWGVKLRKKHNTVKPHIIE